MKTIEIRKGYQIGSSSPANPARMISGHSGADHLTRLFTVARCGQFLGATLIAYGFYFLNNWSGDGVRLLAALAATSALVTIGLATLSRTRALAVLNLLAGPILFATAYAGMAVAAEWLIVSYLLHASFIALQLAAINKELRSGLFSWMVFNTAMALLLLLG